MIIGIYCLSDHLTWLICSRNTIILHKYYAISHSKWFHYLHFHFFFPYNYICIIMNNHRQYFAFKNQSLKRKDEGEWRTYCNH
jgi:hypothetical protein